MRKSISIFILTALASFNSASAQVVETEEVSRTAPVLVQTFPKWWTFGVFYDSWRQSFRYRQMVTVKTRTRTLVSRTTAVTGGVTVAYPWPSTTSSTTITDTHTFTPWVVQPPKAVFFTKKKTGGRWHFFFAPPTQQLANVDQMIVTASDSFLNDWDGGTGSNFTTVTFDGVVIPAGAEIDFGAYPQGDHVLNIFAPNLQVTYTVTIVPECSLEKTAIPYGDRIATDSPFGRATLTNNSDRVIDAVPVASYDTAKYIGLNVTVSPAMVTLQPGDSVEFDLAFSTDPGYVFPLSEPVSAMIDVYEPEDVNVPNTIPLASISLDAAPGFAMDGTREDFVLHLTVDPGDDDHISARYADVGDDMSLFVESPGGAFNGNGYLLFAAIGLDENTAFINTAGLANIHLGQNPVQLASGVIGAGGNPFVLPYAAPSLMGVPIRFQAASFSAQAANGMYATTDALDVYLR